MDKKIVLLLIAFGIILVSCSSKQPPPIPLSNASVHIEWWDRQIIQSGQTALLIVTISKDVVEGDLNVITINGQGYVNISTDEDKHINLTNATLTVTRKFRVSGHTNLTIEPIFKAELNTTSKQLLESNHIRLRIEDLLN